MGQDVLDMVVITHGHGDHVVRHKSTQHLQSYLQIAVQAAFAQKCRCIVFTYKAPIFLLPSLPLRAAC
jgi:hypothetical protein